jgi:hypothetical protein
MVADPVRRRFYATVGGTTTTYPNSLVVIDADSGAVLSSVYVGSQPTALALSDDVSTVWVGLKGSESLRRVDVSTEPPVAGIEHPVPLTLAQKTAYVGELLVLPGTTDSVLAGLYPTGSSENQFDEILVLDDGSPRSERAVSGFKNDPRLLVGATGPWAFATAFSTPRLFVLEVGPEGVTSYIFDDVATQPFLTGGAYAGGRLFLMNGEIVDVSDPLMPVSLAAIGSSLIRPVADGAYAYRFLLSAAGYQLGLYDATAYEYVGWSAVEMPEHTGNWDFVAADDATLGVVTETHEATREVYLIHSPFSEVGGGR